MSKAAFHRRAYDWVLHWAYTPYGAVALFIIALAESSFFPIPPDVLLIALAIGATSKSFKFAALCTVGSVVGGIIGYFIGLLFFDLVGIKILEFYGVMDQYELVRQWYLKWDVWFVGVAGFTPIPYKVFTISAGAFGMNLPAFVIVSAVSRGARFFIVAGLIYKFGRRIREFIDKYFNLLSILFIALLIIGFLVLKVLF